MQQPEVDRMSASAALKQRYAHQVDRPEFLQEGYSPKAPPRGLDWGEMEAEHAATRRMSREGVPRLATENAHKQTTVSPRFQGIADGEIRFSDITARTMTLTWRCQPELKSRDMRYKMAVNGEKGRGDPHTLLVSTGAGFKPVAILDPRDGDGEFLTYTVTHLKAGRHYDFKVQVGNSNVRLEAAGGCTTPAVYQ